MCPSHPSSQLAGLVPAFTVVPHVTASPAFTSVNAFPEVGKLSRGGHLGTVNAKREIDQ